MGDQSTVTVKYYWKKVFAWKPRTTISGERVWLKFVYRRQKDLIWSQPIMLPPSIGTIVLDEFGTIFDVLKDEQYE